MLKILLAIFFIPTAVFAHQPRINNSNSIIVTEPEISKAYYSKFSGDLHTYIIKSTTTFDLYVNLLVPNNDNADTSLSAIINVTGSNDPIAILDGEKFKWSLFWEPFGRSSYLMGPEFDERVSAGEYRISVWDNKNDGVYSIAIGKTERFDLKEILNAVKLIPEIKIRFFNESPASFIFSPIGFVFVIITLVLGFILGFVASKLISFWNGNSPNKEAINKNGRIARLILSLIIFLIAIFTTWNPIIFLISGMLLWEFFSNGIFTFLLRVVNNKLN